MTIDWNIVASISTFIAAFATLLTVYEMRSGRIQSISPDLILLPPLNRYDFRWIPLEDLSPIIRPEKGSPAISTQFSRLPLFFIKNIGGAAAQKVSLRWHISECIDVFHVIEESEILKEYQPRRDQEFIHLNKKITDGSTSWGSPLTTSELTRLQYVVSSPTSEMTDSVFIPNGIANNLWLRLIANPRPTGYDFLDGPKISVEVQYLDLQGREHKRKFSVETSVRFLSDLVGSEENPVEPQFHHSNNFRGSIRFSVTPIGA